MDKFIDIVFNIANKQIKKIHSNDQKLFAKNLNPLQKRKRQKYQILILLKFFVNNVCEKFFDVNFHQLTFLSYLSSCSKFLFLLFVKNENFSSAFSYFHTWWFMSFTQLLVSEASKHGKSFFWLMHSLDKTRKPIFQIFMENKFNLFTLFHDS